MSILRKLLFPFAILYGIIIRVRNYLYDEDVLKSSSYTIPVICVGNLSVGGTGKSPMIEYLLNLLVPHSKVATLSRGYGRTTKGFILLNGLENASEVGDEPLQFKTKFKDVLIAVDENRQHGIQVLKDENNAEVILLDDAFQHRKVKAGLNIVLTKFDSLYIDDLMLPAGDLREPIAGVERAQIIVVTKCPKLLSEQDAKKICEKLKLKNYQKLFFSYIDYSQMVISSSGSKSITSFEGTKITLVTGIANPKSLLHYLDEIDIKYDHLNYPDHHNFSKAELEQIAQATIIITTEKDYMRLKDKIVHPDLYYLPIKMKFISNTSEFDGMVKKFIE
ncbi:lipid-A-disaccharide kinase [Gillisia sp. Hel1_33_143]|uniref:tetraacyldisaccharide 4'-kinase n=1 Tax=Gillisia sp. Hel1_33_143 TaxID=1336796 RepID=UPI00087C653A|nr:tetraacyldisaccharide 4'-kinase [Gillisia sp. Hel1_33_143]SDR66749.1 lipid-A-disaccharide kinase [Gillisia sp. Hel1_33_143]